MKQPPTVTPSQPPAAADQPTTTAAPGTAATPPTGPGPTPAPTGGTWRYRTVNTSTLLAPGAGNLARERLYSIREVIGLPVGVTDADVKAAGTYATQMTEVRFDALEIIKKDYPDLAPSSKMPLAEVQVRRDAITETESVDNALTLVARDVKVGLAVRNTELLGEFTTTKGDLDIRRAATLATDNPDQRTLAASDVVNNAAAAAAVRAQQGKTDKAHSVAAIQQMLDDALAELAKSNDMVQTLQDELAKQKSSKLLDGTPPKHAKPAPPTPPNKKGQRKSTR